ncbi:hypothetical protein Tsubulata_037276 [Turnera subulata]|uniref:RRM domain-containing protein n=1 Tax=Turnera subulata TaxID=218843 RepID=A0A9Q0GA60_9ROSI|nr:hypothetical protein Tsubulata_037276 [Turnera subulata]
MASLHFPSKPNNPPQYTTTLTQHHTFQNGVETGVLSKYGVVIDVYIPKKINKEKKRFGFVYFRGVKDLRRLLSDVNRVQVENGVVRANFARARQSKNPKTTRQGSLTHGHRVLSGRSFAETVRGANPVHETNQPEAVDAGITFIPTTETLQWLSRCAVRVLERPGSMESVHLLWTLHGMWDVVVSKMGGDKALVCFLSTKARSQFLQQNHEWVQLWFQSLQPWTTGDRATNQCCWLKIRGLPLNAWCQEFFELVEMLTTQGGLINKRLKVKVMGQLCNIEVMEIAKEHRKEEDSSLLGDASGSEVPVEAPVNSEAGTQNVGDATNQSASPEIGGDPFNLMPIIVVISDRG